MKLMRKENLLESFDRYDLEVEDNHNFFVSGVAVHNCSCSLTYRNGVLTRAVTRGNGEEGQDVTDNVRMMASVPKRLVSGFFGEVRGEVFMRRSVFAELNEELVRQGKKPFANTRNAASGSLTCQDPKETGSRNLDLFVYEVIPEDEVFSTELEKRNYALNHLGDLEQVPAEVILIQSFEAVATRWEASRPALDYGIDGLVVSLDSIEEQEAAGFNGRNPRGKIAYKFKPEQQTAKVIGIDWQVGRTGRLTPMARIEPTFLAGSTIRNITLHNAARLRELRLDVGDVVLISKAGDIIPQVEKNLSDRG